MTILPFKNILVPMDFSDPARNALTSAVEIAEKFSARIFLLHVMAPAPILPPSALPSGGTGVLTGTYPGIDVAMYEKELTESNKKRLIEISAEIVPKSIECIECLEIGEAGCEIPPFAEKHNIDLIIISTHGLSGLSRFFMGSVTDKVLRAVTMPVMVVRHATAEE